MPLLLKFTGNAPNPLSTRWRGERAGVRGGIKRAQEEGEVSFWTACRRGDQTGWR